MQRPVHGTNGVSGQTAVKSVVSAELELVLGKSIA